MTNYFYIKNNEIIGCGQARIMNDDIINAEVTDDMVNFDETDPTWESDRFKWKYKWNGKKIIDNPDFEKEEIKRYNEAMRQARLEEYINKTDGLVARRIRKQAINDWSENDESEFIDQMTILSAEISEKYPYIDTDESDEHSL